jgi:hypothetical protein
MVPVLVVLAVKSKKVIVGPVICAKLGSAEASMVTSRNRNAAAFVVPRRRRVGAVRADSEGAGIFIYMGGI